MHYDEYTRMGNGMGSGAVESAHKQVIHARMRQAGMRWSEAGAHFHMKHGQGIKAGRSNQVFETVVRTRTVRTPVGKL